MAIIYLYEKNEILNILKTLLYRLMLYQTCRLI